MPALGDGIESHVSSAVRQENVAFEGSPDAIRTIAKAGARGTFVVAGLSVAALLFIWLAFFLFAYLPRGAVG